MKLCYTTYPNSKWTQYPTTNQDKTQANGLKQSSSGNAANGYYSALCEPNDIKRNASTRNGKRDTGTKTYDRQIP